MSGLIKTYRNFSKVGHTFSGLRAGASRLVVAMPGPSQFLTFLPSSSSTWRGTIFDFCKMIPRALGCWT
jgi:hypothetical protein